MEILCEVHQKPMKQNSRGVYCSTPVRKTPDGKNVLEWCTWKPAQSSTPERQQLEAKVLANMNNKLDQVLADLAQIKGDLANRP